jgi:hypothetical protein
MMQDILPVPPVQVPVKQEQGYPQGFKLKLKVDDTDYYSKKLDQHFDSY